MASGTSQRHLAKKYSMSESFFYFLAYFDNSYIIFLVVPSGAMTDNFLVLLLKDMQECE